MAAENRIFSTEDTLKLIADKAKESDAFWVKVQRRAHPGAHPVIVASLSGATAQHFASPELWLPPLCGGGKFLLLAYHESDLNKMIGGAIFFPVDGVDVRDVDYSIFDSDGNAKRADWRGPACLQFPKPAAPSQQRESMPMYGIHAPPAPGSGDSATINKPAWPRSAGGGVHREAYDDYGNPLGQKAAGIEAERRMLEKERLDNERQRHRDELDALKRTHDSELKSLEARLEAKFTAAARPAGPDPVVTVLTKMMEMSAEDRREATRQAAEDRRLAAERQAKADERFAAVLEKLSDKKGPDPLELVEKVSKLVAPKNDDNAMMKTVHNMVEMQGSMVGAAMDFVEHASRMQLGGGGEDEPRWMKGVERLLKGVGKMATAAQMRQPQFVQPPQFAAPPQQVPQGVPPPPRGAQPPPRPQQPPHTDTPIVDQIEQAIRNHHNPDEVAAALIKFYQDPSVQQALQAAGGDFEKALQMRLGNWASESPKNGEYLQKLFQSLQRLAAQFGASVVNTDEEEDAEYEEDDDQGDEPDDDQGDEPEE